MASNTRSFMRVLVFIKDGTKMMPKIVKYPALSDEEVEKFMTELVYGFFGAFGGLVLRRTVAAAVRYLLLVTHLLLMLL